MKFLAFDLGSTWAFAATNMDGSTFGNHTKNEGLRPQRLNLFRGQLYDLFKAFYVQHLTFDAVVYERPFARGLHATRSLWGMAGILEAVVTEWGYPILDIVPSQIKKFATGHGLADKEAMLAAARQMGYGGFNEHEADAFCLLKYAEKNATSVKATANENSPP